jgi:hypothetical protein
MSLESSHEGTEHEQPRLITSAQTDLSPAVQGKSGGEQLLANVIPAPVPPDPDELVALLLTWIRTPDWFTSQTYLRAHSELLTEASMQVLATITQHQPDQQVQELLMLHQQLLQIAGQQGVEAAYQSLLYQEEKNDGAYTEEEELQVQVIAWIQTPDWKTSQIYLQNHPQLFTDAAEQMMGAPKRSQSKQAQAMINLHLDLLQKARLEGIEVAYKRFLVPEPETPLSDQEMVSYQVLQDPATLNEAGIATLRRYWVSGQVADMNRELERWNEALNLIPPGSPEHPGRLSNLGIGLSIRYERTGNLADLDAAITTFQQAVQAAHPDSPTRPGRLSNLGAGLQDRYARTGNLADLDAAVTAFQQAIQAASPDSPDLPGLLKNLGIGLSDRYARTRNLADLESAITAWEKSWSLPHPRFTAFPVSYLLGQQRQGAGTAAHLVKAYLEQAKHLHPHSSSVPRRALEIAECDRYSKIEPVATLKSWIASFSPIGKRSTVMTKQATCVSG